MTRGTPQTFADYVPKHVPLDFGFTQHPDLGEFMDVSVNIALTPETNGLDFNIGID